jgi:hypothetical protein
MMRGEIGHTGAFGIFNQEADMRRTLLALSVAVLTIVTLFTTGARAQETKKARGTVTAMSAATMTVQVAGTAMNFAVDSKTVVEARGAGTASKKAAADNKPGPSLSEVIKVGQAVEVSYHDAGGTMHAAGIRAIAASELTPSTAKSSTGKVSSVSANSLTISGSGGSGATFTQTFVIGPNTKVVEKGAGTMAAKTGGKAVATDLVHTGDTVHVAFSDANGTLQATTVTVTTKAVAK